MANIWKLRLDVVSSISYYKDGTNRRYKIQSGDLLAWDGETGGLWDQIATKFVRFFTMSEYGHVGIAYVVANTVFALEATIPKILLRPIVKQHETYDVYVVPMNITWSDEMLKMMLNYVDCDYSFMDCIRAYLGITTSKDDNWQCAELVDDFYKRIGIELNPDKMTPSGIVKAALKRSGEGLLTYNTGFNFY